MIASFLESNACAVAGDRTAEFSPGVRVLADCGADGARYGTVAAALYAAEGDLTTVTLTLDGDGLTANLAAVLHGNDVPASLANHGHTGPADGGAVAHGALAGVGTNSHAAIDAFLASKAAASGLASLDAASRVVQDPANATATPGGTKIVMSDASGTVDAWVSDATTGGKGKVRLATVAETQAGACADKAVTPAGLAGAAKGLIVADTTLHVATTGSDATGDGSPNAPFASISQALASIRNKLVASGVTVTIQVADGTYAVTSTITINHPDADKIQIIGNTSAETVVAIAAIDTTARTIAVAGDRTSSLSAGDTAGVTGSAGNNGTYTVLSATYSGGATVIAVSEAIPSATADGTLTIKPCNRCVLQLSNGARGFSFTTGINAVDGFAIVGDGSTSSIGLMATGGPAVLVGAHMIVRHAYFGAYGTMGGGFNLLGGLLHNNTYGLYADTGGKAILSGTLVIDGATVGLVASNISIIRTLGNAVYGARTADPATPDYDTAGNANSYISSS